MTRENIYIIQIRVNSEDNNLIAFMSKYRYRSLALDNMVEVIVGSFLHKVSVFLFQRYHLSIFSMSVVLKYNYTKANENLYRFLSASNLMASLKHLNALDSLC